MSSFFSGLLCSFLGLFGEEPSWQMFPVWGGGYIQNVEMSTSNPDVWYAYVDVCGPYRSDDAGLNWRPLHQAYSMSDRGRGMNPRSLSIDPRDPDSIVYAVGNNWRQSGYLFVSRDGGKTIRPTARDVHFYGNGARRTAGILLDRSPFDPDQLVAAPDSDGILLSADNGETWKNVGLQRHFFTDVRYDLGTRGRLFACAPACPAARSANGKPREAGFYRSDDGGRTWRRLQEESPLELCQTRGQGRPLLAHFGGVDLRLSADGGETWTPYAQGLPQPGDAYLTAGRFQAIGAGSDFFVAADTAGNIYRRGLGEASWSRVVPERLTNRDPQMETHLMPSRKFAKAATTIKVDPRDDRHWLLTDWYAIWETQDAGASWHTAIRNICPLISFTVAADPFNGDNLIYGAADLVFFVSRDGGKSFSHDERTYAGKLGGATSIAFSSATRGAVFLCGGKSGSVTILRSTDGMTTWSVPQLKGLPRLAAGQCAVYTLAEQPGRERLFACVSGTVEPGKGGVYVSSDLGDSWTWFGTGLPADMSYAKSEWDSAINPQIAVGPDGGAVTFNRRTKQLYFLADRERGVWEPSSLRFTSWAQPVIAADPSVPGHFLAACANGEFAESVDGGRTFRLRDDVPERIESISFDAHTPGWLVLGCNGILRLSRDGGKTFEALTDVMGLPTGHSTRTVIDRRRLFLITGASGVFQRRLD